MRWRKSYKMMTILHSIAGILVFIGLYTQAALLAVIILLVIDIVLDNKSSVKNPHERMVSMMIAIIAFCLLFLGPGSFAFDLPL
jgi:uncharacterized membrane protein YphA (DoxX/SURF4 family)